MVCMVFLALASPASAAPVPRRAALSMPDCSLVGGRLPVAFHALGCADYPHFAVLSGRQTDVSQSTVSTALGSSSGVVSSTSVSRVARGFLLRC